MQREEFFQKNNLKILKCSPADETVKYHVVYPNTQEDISELIHMREDRNNITIQAFEEVNQTRGIKFVY